MKALKIFTLVLITIVLVFAGWIYLAGMGAEQTVLSAAYYEGLLNEIAVFEQVYESLQTQIEEEMLAHMPEEFAGAVVGAFTDAFPLDWLENQVLLAVDDALAWVKGEQESPSMIIDLRENRELLREALLATLQEMAHDLPADILPHPDLGIEGIVSEMLQEMDLPEEIALAGLISEEALSPEAAENISKFQLYRGYFQYVPYILFALLLLFSCLLAGLTGGLKWFGTAALISGAIFFSLLQVVRALFLSRFVSLIDLELPLDFETLISAARYTITRLATAPLIFAAAGLLILILGIVLGLVLRKQKAAAESL